MVVMKGEAMTAGSMPIFSATMGRVQPTTLAHSTVNTRVRQTTRATIGVTSGLCISQWSTNIIFAKLATARHRPHSTDTRISFHTTAAMSENSISPRDRARITATDDWEPEFPPVPDSMGIKEVSTTQAASADSKLVMMMPVKVADSMSSISQGMRERQVSNTPVLR